MADLDEAPLLHKRPGSIPGSASNNQDTSSQPSDDEEEDSQRQDFRFLVPNSKQAINQTSTSQEGQSHLLPRRGEKDFEPHGTQAQSSTLAQSQAAMHAALSVSRVHGPSSKAGHLVGYFDSESGLTYVPKEQGVWFRSMGRAVKGGKGGATLEPEEALWLCERGSMEMRFGSAESDATRAMENDQSDLVPLDGLPMSLQAAYACCIGSRGLTLERYIVYAGLKRAGYSVFRGKHAWEEDENGIEGQSLASQSPGISLQDWLQDLVSRISNATRTRKSSLPIIGTTFFRDYVTIYNRLAIIPTHTISSSTTPSTRYTPIPNTPRRDPDNLPLQITYNAYRPNTTIKKSSLPAPDFQLVVLDARETNFPTPTQLSDLLARISYDREANREQRDHSKTTSSPSANSSVYNTLKTGGENAILAVVDSGLVSYIRIAEGVFANEKVWKRNPTVIPPPAGNMGAARGSARGGRGGSARGRGRGRGGSKGNAK